MNEKVETISNHVVILGWSSRVERIIKELRNEVHRASGDIRPILVITEYEDKAASSAFERVYFMYGRLNDVEVLRRAHLDTAHSLLIPAVLPQGQVADGQNVFSLLAALTVNPALRVCVEVSQVESGETLGQIHKRSLSAGDIEVVSFESVADRLLAQAAVSSGVTRVYDHLLSFAEDSNEIYVSELSPRWHGKTFRQLAMACFETEVILLGYENDGGLVLNPKERDYVFAPGNRAWFLSYNRAAGLKVVNPEFLVTNNL